MSQSLAAVGIDGLTLISGLARSENASRTEFIRCQPGLKLSVSKDDYVPPGRGGRESDLGSTSWDAYARPARHYIGVALSHREQREGETLPLLLRYAKLCRRLPRSLRALVVRTVAGVAEVA
jgi:hypothetical protein